MLKKNDCLNHLIGMNSLTPYAQAGSSVNMFFFSTKAHNFWEWSWRYLILNIANLFDFVFQLFLKL